MVKNFTSIIIIIIFSFFSLAAQDAHFSQFYASPLTLNPALTGTFDGTFRLGTIYRDQWNSVLDNSFATFSAAMEVRFDANFFSPVSRDYAAIGLLFFTDKAGDLEFSNNQIGISAAYHKSLDIQKTQYLTIGFQGSLHQRNVNYANLNFHDEFDGLTGYNLPSGEVLPENNHAFSDINVGVNYAFSPESGPGFFAGLALHHVLQPQVSFYSGDEFGGDEVLYTKLSGQFSARIPLGEKIWTLPRFLFARQGPHIQINAGNNFRFLLNEFSGIALHIGGWARPVKSKDGQFDLDAIVGFLGLEYSNVLLGMSYDATLNDLTNERSGQGSFEVSVSYLGNYENETVLCPKF